MRDADRIFSVPGIDAMFVGPNDLAASMRGQDGRPPDGAATADANRQILAACKKHGVAAGYHCTTAEEVIHRVQEGWQFLAIGSELKMMTEGAAAAMRAVGAGGVGDIARY